jgi:mevalonate kinase
MNAIKEVTTTQESMLARRLAEAFDTTSDDVKEIVIKDNKLNITMNDDTRFVIKVEEKSASTSTTRQAKWTKEECEASLREFIAETGCVSNLKYQAWSTGRNKPAFGTIMRAFGGVWPGRAIQEELKQAEATK